LDTETEESRAGVFNQEPFIQTELHSNSILPPSNRYSMFI
jgi:hypothetical protein